MAITPTIVSPGIEIREYDRSIRATVSGSTVVWIPGFASAGPTSEVIYVSSLEDFTSTFGMPTNAAERYFYATVSQVLQSAGTVAVTRLPYGAGEGDTTSPQFTILAYPAKGVALDADGKYKVVTAIAKTDLPTELQDDYPEGLKVNDKVTKAIHDIIVEHSSTLESNFTALVAYHELEHYSDGSAGFVDETTGELKYKDSATFLIGEPVQFNISLEQYYNFLNGQTLDGTGEFSWADLIPSEVSTDISDLGKFAFMTLNIGKTVTNDQYEGYYLALSDNAFSDPGLDNGTQEYAAVKRLKTVTELPSSISTGLTGTDYTTIPSERLDFKLNSDIKGCISQVMQESVTSFDISEAQYNDTLNFGLFKIRESTNGDALKLSAVYSSGFNAAIEAGRKTTSKYSTTAVNFFVEDIAKEKSISAFSVYVNPYFSGLLNGRGLNTDGTPKIKVRMFADQLHEIALKDDEVTEANLDKVMAAPAGITQESIESITGMKKSDALYPIGLYAASNSASKVIGNVPAKVTTAANLISNEELYDIDIVVEGGLGQIYVGAMDTAREAFTKLTESEKSALSQDEQNGEYVAAEMHYDDTKVIKGVTNMRTGKALDAKGEHDGSEEVVTDFKAVQSAFLKLACSQQDGGRGDVFFVGDGIRQISVEGKDNKIEKRFGMPLISDVYTSADAVKHSFSTSIYWPLRHLYDGVATSYMAVYPQYIKLQNPTNATQYWAPSSGAIVRKLASTDSLYGPWQAAAGLNNGGLPDVIDISYNTNQRQRDDLYKISLNTIVSSPSAGITIWGIRTMIKKSSAFDQITCRRTFLYMEKILRDSSRQFLFEGNTSFTREKVVSVLKPIFDRIVNARGIYDYVLVCDNRNNTPDVVDAGYLQIDFYASPVRTAERILINATASGSGAIVTEYDA